MDDLPEEILQQIVSYICDARDIASCRCVARQWKDAVSRVTTLHFADESFCCLRTGDPNTVVQSAVRQMLRLEKLAVHGSLLKWELASWVSHAASSPLRHLDLWETGGQGGHLHLIKQGRVSSLQYLETLRLRNFYIGGNATAWGILPRLTSLELTDAKLESTGLSSALRDCRNLTSLVISRCSGSLLLRINLPRLEQCSIELTTLGSYFFLKSPKIRSLTLQGFACVMVFHTGSLRSLSIDVQMGLRALDLGGGLPVLEYLSMTGCPLCWEKLSKVLQSPSKVKHLTMDRSVCIDLSRLHQEVDIVNFFSNHPKLETLEIDENMLAFLSRKNTPRDVGQGFAFPHLKEVLVTLSSASNVQQKLENLEFMIKYGKNLKSIVILLPQAGHLAGETDFSDVIDRFRSSHHEIVTVQQ